jgi:hypothetical protein
MGSRGSQDSRLSNAIGSACLPSSSQTAAFHATGRRRLASMLDSRDPCCGGLRYPATVLAVGLPMHRRDLPAVTGALLPVICATRRAPASATTRPRRSAPNAVARTIGPLTANRALPRRRRLPSASVVTDVWRVGLNEVRRIPALETDDQQPWRATRAAQAPKRQVVARIRPPGDRLRAVDRR